MARYALLVFMFVAVSTATCAGDPVLRRIDGQAFVRKAGAHTGFERAADGAALETGSLIRCGDAFRGSLEYPDGTVLRLKAGATLEVLPGGLRLQQGSVWIKVEKTGRSFRCVTPSAIASVRGTSFSADVTPLGRVLWHGLARAHSAAPVLGHVPRSDLVADAVGLTLLLALWQTAPGGRLPSTVRVYSGSVHVVRADARTGRIIDSVTVGADQKVQASGARLTAPAPLVGADYGRWGLPTPEPATEGAAGATATGAAAGLAAGGGAPVAEGGRPVPLMILDEIAEEP